MREASGVSFDISDRIVLGKASEVGGRKGGESQLFFAIKSCAVEKDTRRFPRFFSILLHITNHAVIL